jgi:hypothetical protein
MKHLRFVYHPPHGPALVLPRCRVWPYSGYSTRSAYVTTTDPHEVACPLCRNLMRVDSKRRERPRVQPA